MEFRSEVLMSQTVDPIGVCFNLSSSLLYNRLMTQKLYCYVDESGQDTGGKIFIVSVVVTKTEKEKEQSRLLGEFVYQHTCHTQKKPNA